MASPSKMATRLAISEALFGPAMCLVSEQALPWIKLAPSEQHDGKLRVVCCSVYGRAGALPQPVRRIDGQAFKALDQTARPAHFDPVRLGGRAQSKMHAHVVIRDVARAAAHFVYMESAAGFHPDL